MLTLEAKYRYAITVFRNQDCLLFISMNSYLTFFALLYLQNYFTFFINDEKPSPSN